MNFRSLDDLHRVVHRSLARIGTDHDMVYAVPRSGLLPGVYMALMLNVPYATPSVSAPDAVAHGQTRPVRPVGEEPRRILIVDDSVNSGNSMAAARQVVQERHPRARITTMVVYGLPETDAGIDIVCETVAQPRVFEWNLFHHHATDRIGFDLDGILCDDPPRGAVPGSDEYRHHIKTVAPRVVPSKVLGGIVTSRSIDDHDVTTSWLEEHDIRYSALHCFDGSTDARRAMRLHAEFKASVYADSRWSLFVESEPAQAFDIGRLSHKPVVCLAPPARTVVTLTTPGRRHLGRLARLARGLVGAR